MRGWRVHSSEPIIRWLLRGRWLLPLFIVAASAFHEAILRFLQPHVPPAVHPWTPVLVYGFTGTVVTWWGLTYLAQLLGERAQAERQLREAYDQLKATHRRLLAMHDIGREIAQAADMRHVLEVAARAPTTLANAKGAAVFTFDDEHNRLHLDAAWGLSETYLKHLRERIASATVVERCRNCTILEARVSGDCPLFDGLEDIAAAEGIGSLACLPFGRGERRDGIITAYFASPEGPPVDDVQLLAIVAAEIASVLESLRLRRQQVATLHQFEQILDTFQDETALLEHLLSITLTVWGVRRGAIYRPNQERCVLMCAYPEAPSPDLAAVMDQVACRVVHTHAPYVIPDLRLAPESNNVRLFGSLAGIPILSGHDLFGVMVLIADEAGFFRAQHATFLLSVGHYAGLAISNARLQAQVEHMAVIEERYRLAREIHDGLAQTLSFIGWRLDRATRLMEQGRWEDLETELEEIRQGLREAYLDVREAIDGLRLNLDHPEGLVGALREYIAGFQARTGLNIAFQAHVSPDKIPPEVAVQLLRIAQESLTNVRKHARARRVWVTLAQEGDAVVLRVQDDGIGFDPSRPQDRDHVGLSSMRERAAKIGGEFQLSSRPGQGTSVQVRVPLRTPLSEAERP